MIARTICLLCAVLWSSTSTSADWDTIASCTLCNLLHAEAMITALTTLPQCFSFSIVGSLSDAQQPIARPVLFRLEEAGVGAGVLRVVYDPIRLVVMSIVQ
jgi:hypothetical protein